MNDSEKNFTLPPDFSGFDPETGERWMPRKVVQLMGLKNLSKDLIQSACEKVIAENSDKVISYKSGKINLMGYFIKLVLDETNKEADPKIAAEILKDLLK